MEQERERDEAGPPTERAEGLPLRHRIAAWIVGLSKTLQEREEAAYNSGAMTAALYSAHRSYHAPQPGVVVQSAIAFTRAQLALMQPWEFGELEPRVRLELLQKMAPMLYGLTEYSKYEDWEANQVQFRARLVVHRIPHAGETIIQEAGKEARRAVPMPGDGSGDPQGSPGVPFLFGGRQDPGVLPETPVGDKKD